MAIYFFVDNHSIVIKNFIKFSKLEEDELIKIILLEPPILYHATGHLLPSFSWHVERCGVIALIFGPPHISVSDNRWLRPIRFAFLNHLRGPMVVRAPRWVESCVLSGRLYAVFIDLLVLSLIVFLNFFGRQLFALFDRLLSRSNVHF